MQTFICTVPINIINFSGGYCRPETYHILDHSLDAGQSKFGVEVEGKRGKKYDHLLTTFITHNYNQSLQSYRVPNCPLNESISACQPNKPPNQNPGSHNKPQRGWATARNTAGPGQTPLNPQLIPNAAAPRINLTSISLIVFVGKANRSA